MKRIIFIVLLATLVLFPQKETKVKELKAEKNAKPAAGSNVKSASMQGDFIYNPMGRRDPFWDLLKRNSSKLKKKRKAGLAGLDIDQLELEGIIREKGVFIALLKGPDGRPYLVKKGDSVYDGEILEIGSHMVKFKKILTIALGGTKERTIIKRLNPEEEDERKNEK